MNQNRAPLLEALQNYTQKDVIPFDVPGHKRGRGISQEFKDFLGEKVLKVDINSLPELDNLNYPTGVIKEAQDLLAKAYGADYAFFMVNGTSSSVHAMILSACSPGEKILIPRNSHKSAINALILCDALPVFMQPEVHEELGFATGVTLETVKKTIEENPDAKAILLINPTYYGICCELKAIIDYAHKKGLKVLVDEAHGAHFGFHDELPQSAMALGADMTAVSIHKTGGSLTQSSAVLLKGNRIIKSHVQAILNIIQTTSASYLLMSSLDAARKNLVMKGKEMITDVLSMVRKAREELNKIDGIYAFGKELIGMPGIFDFDETKLGINVSKLGLTGCELYDILSSEYNIQLELNDVFTVLAIVSLGDCEKNLTKLVSAIKEIAQKYGNKHTLEFNHIPLENPEIVINPRSAFYSNKGFVPLDSCPGHIMAEMIMAYPPGIPILLPGERITKDHIDYIKYLKTQKIKLTDMNDEKVNNLLVVCE